MRRLGLISLCIFLFQNCGHFEAKTDANIYPYEEQTDFFYDLRIRLSEIDSANRKKYVFDLVASHAGDPSQTLSYRLRFSTPDFEAVCATREGSLDGCTKHIDNIECLIPTHESLFVQLTLTGPDDETLVEEFRFD